MINILDTLSSEAIIGLRMNGESYDCLNYGKIVGYDDNYLDLIVYDENGNDYDQIKVLQKDIVSFDVDSACTRYLAKKSGVVPNVAAKEERKIEKSEVRDSLYSLWNEEVPALFHTSQDEIYGFIVAYDDRLAILHVFNPYYNIDYGFLFIKIEEIESLYLNKPELAIYFHIYENNINHHKLQLKCDDIRTSFFDYCREKQILVDAESFDDINNGEVSVGYVESIEGGNVRFRMINDMGLECGIETYNIDDIMNFGCGGYYLEKISILHKNHLSELAKEQVYIVDNLNELERRLYKAKQEKEIVTLISDETEEEFFESTGFVVDIDNEWIHMRLYDIDENDWYDYYRRIKDFTQLRKNGIVELLVKTIYKTKNNLGSRNC